MDALVFARAGEAESADEALALSLTALIRRLAPHYLSVAEASSTTRRMVDDFLRNDWTETQVDPEYRSALRATSILRAVCLPSRPSQLCGSSAVAALELAYEASLEKSAG
jgi:hypothetical protein